MRQRGLALWIIIMVIVAVGATVAIASSYFGDDVVEQAEEAMSSGYPSMWVEAGLPEYPGAEFLKGRQGNNLNDGVQITVQTSDDINTVKAYFDSEMTNRGFTMSATLPGNDFASYSTYESGDKRMSLTITKVEDTTNYKVHAVYSE